MTVADFDMPYPQYHCPSCGKDLPLGEARMTIMCAEHFFGDKLDFTVREALPADRGAIEEICDRALGEIEVDVFGQTYDVTQGVNLIADVGGKLGGLLSMAIDRGELVIVLLSVYPEYQGRSLGSMLLNSAISFAAARSLPIVRVAVSNDDIPLLYFYQRNGFTIYDVAIGCLIDESGTSAVGFSEILSRDEIHLRRPVCGKC